MTPLGGAVDLSKAKTVGKLKAFKHLSHAQGHRLLNCDLHNHHTVPVQWAKQLLIGKPGMPTTLDDDLAWNAILDDMPGLLVDVHHHIHTGEGIEAGISSFHGILRTQSQPLIDQGIYSSDQILLRLETAYGTWDSDLGPHVWAAAKAWLETKGVVAP